MRLAFTLLACALGVAGAQTTPPTAISVQMLLEFKTLLASPNPCLLVMGGGKVQCVTLGAGLTWSQSNGTWTISGAVGSVIFPSPVGYPVTTSGTQTFTTTVAAVETQNPGNSAARYWVWRGGTLLWYGVDYTESGNTAGSTITLLAGQTTVAGETIQIW